MMLCIDHVVKSYKVQTSKLLDSWLLSENGCL